MIDLYLRSLFEFSLGTKQVFPPVVNKSSEQKEDGLSSKVTPPPSGSLSLTPLLLFLSLLSCCRPRLDTLCFYLMNHKSTVTEQS